MTHLKKALESIGLEILGYDPKKKKPVKLSRGPDVSVEAFSQQLLKELKSNISKFGDLQSLIWDAPKMEEELSALADSLGVLKGKPKNTPEELQDLKLYCDITAKGRDRFFLATKSGGIKSLHSGDYYIMRMGLNDMEAMAQAEGVMPRYMPRDPPGVEEREQANGEIIKVFNEYIPAKWRSYTGDTKDCLPPLFLKLVKCIIPVREEREYFFSWVNSSLFDRSLVYLILCGIPGLGKNVLISVLAALHGDSNSVNGKESTIRDKFNSQLAEATFVAFDDVAYDKDMENTMKGWQNTTTSIEKKGVDQTKSTPIHASILIANNKPKDNFITFDARKFAPLITGSKQLLDGGMTPEEVTTLVEKVKETGPNYDIAFVAQIGRWVEKHGMGDKWAGTNMEYWGPMFWRLAHTSMFHWQKVLIDWLLNSDPTRLASVDQAPDKGFLWSSLRDRIYKRNKDRGLRFPDPTSVSEFLKLFRSLKGEIVFEVEEIKGSMTNDFWIKIIFMPEKENEYDL